MKAKYSYYCLIIGIILFLFYIFIPLSPSKEILQKESHYAVNLKPNPFYDTTKLFQNTLYPSEGISNYSLDISYHFSNPKNKIVTYEYEILYEIIGTVPDESGLDQNIWEKTISIKPKTTYQTTKDFFINENILVDYPVYNELAHSYEDAYNLSLKSLLKVKIPLTYTIEEKNKTIQKESCIEYVITLEDGISSIHETKEIETPTEKKEVSIIPYLSIFFLLLGIGGLLKKKLKKEKNTKQKENRFLKEYKNQIISVEQIPNINNVTVFELSSIEDLIRLATQYEIHIIYQTKEKCFYLFLENCVYLLKDSSM